MPLKSGYFPLQERLKKFCGCAERGFLVFWRGFGDGAGCKTLLVPIIGLN
jgi:hypothetical protein